MNESLEKKSDDFWYNNPSVLWDKNRFIEFFPNPRLSLAEKLNSLVRLSFYVCIILMIFFGNYLYLYIPIVVLALTYLIYTNYKPPKPIQLEGYKSLINSEFAGDGELSYSPEVINTGQIETSLGNIQLTPDKCKQPTVNNPFMNANLITDKRDRPPACPYYDNEKVAAKVESDFDYNLYRDVSDLYNKRNSQRQYYTMPATTIPNEQTSFAKWCYLSPPTCKEDSIRCVPETTQPPLPGNGLEYLQLQN